MSNPVSESIRALRKQHNLTQNQLAKMAAIPRATLANMENAAGNPSITTVVKVATALGVSIEDLVENKQNTMVTEVTRDEMQVLKQDDDRYTSTRLSPINAPYIHINEVNMVPGCNTLGKPHPKGSHEFFCCLEGTATVKVKDDPIEVKAGNMIYFPGNIPHTYINNGLKPVHAIAIISIVDFAKAGK